MKSILKKFFFRAVIGAIIILCVNQILTYKGISIDVGLNAVTVLTTGVLGIPGVALLYGIMAL